MDFREVDRRYAELKWQYDARDLTNKEFDAELRRLMVQDDEGRWWAKSRESGRWYYNDGNDWVASTPPGYQTRPQTLPAEGRTDHQALSVEESTPEPPATTRAGRTEPPADSQVQDQCPLHSEPGEAEQTSPTEGKVRNDPPLHPGPGQVERTPPSESQVQSENLLDPQPAGETEQLPSAPTPGSSSVQDQNRTQWQRRVPRWVKIAVPIAALGLIGVLALLGVLVAVFTTDSDTGIPNPIEQDIEVPNLIGQTGDEAEDSVGEDFDVKINERVSNETKGTIIDQDPGPGEQAERGSTLTLFRSGGQPPNLGDIFRDDFSDTSSGWARQTGQSDEFTVNYADGGYRMYNPVTADSFVSVRIPQAGTVEEGIVEVDVTRTGDTPSEGAWGIMCGRVDEDNYFIMGITSNGGSFLRQIKDGDPGTRISNQPNDAIRTESGATNHIRADCVGDAMNLYVNDEDVMTTIGGPLGSSGFAPGQVGLFAINSADEGPAVDVTFDNFLVSTP